MASSASTCESDLSVLGLQTGEVYATPARILSTLISITLVAAWTPKKIRRLSLFFSHWLSGVVMSLGFVIDEMMVTLCLANSNVANFIKTLKFIELSASNMLSITNLTISVNLALIVMAHRTMSSVKSVSSPRLILVMLVISMVIAAISIPFWDIIIVSGTTLWVSSHDAERYEILTVLSYIVELFVGACMLLIVILLALFWVRETKKCWMLHRRSRYYFILTISGTAVNLGLGICGSIRTNARDQATYILIWSWAFRYIYIVLDTIVLYGVLRERSIDERGRD
eukprot:g11873.t1